MSGTIPNPIPYKQGARKQAPETVVEAPEPEVAEAAEVEPESTDDDDEGQTTL